MFILCVAVCVVPLLCSKFFHIGTKMLKNGNRCSLSQREKADRRGGGEGQEEKKKRFIESNDSIQQ